MRSVLDTCVNINVKKKVLQMILPLVDVLCGEGKMSNRDHSR